ncbi:MAG: dehypoxanthine futalosine cyclase [Planctomycetota bacterium]|nr:dehypoxanthine futalosine cyclase [Planctomycetota bacterium]
MTGSQRRTLETAYEKAAAHQRLTLDEGVALLERGDTHVLAALAHKRRMHLHPEPVVTYIIERNINYTNSCVTYCRFCAFYRRPDHSEVYVLTNEQLRHKIQEMVDAGGIQILLQGGHHPDLRLTWYEEMLRFIKGEFPQINVHGFSAPELEHIANLETMPVRDVIARLRDAGLGTLPGAGGEMLVDRVRQIIAPLKTTTDTWIDVHRQAHQLGMRSTATMMFGHAETVAERVVHMDHVRRLQDETEGFTAFILWTFQPDNTAMWRYTKLESHDYLRAAAVSRLYLDNVQNLQASWVTQGPRVAEISLRCGVNDMGSTMFEENVVSAAGTTYCMNWEQIERSIRLCGFEPRRRNVLYEKVAV